MRKLWIVLLVAIVVGSVLALPGTAFAKGGPGGGHGTPPAPDEPAACGSSSLPLILGPTATGYVSSACADVGSDLNGTWTVTFTGYAGKASLVAQLRNSIPGDRCAGDLVAYASDGTVLLSGNGSGVTTHQIEDGSYYTLDTTTTELVDGNCTGGDGTVELADADPGFVFSVDLQTKRLTSPITVDIEFVPAS